MSELEKFVQFLKILEHRWDALRKSESQDEKSLRAEFSELITLTLNSSLDFRNLQANSEIDECWEKIRIIIASLNLQDCSNQSINNVLNVDKWTSSLGLWLLSGKSVGSSKLNSFDTKLMYESDEVINVRLESLMKLLENSNNDDTEQMVLNVYETYRKFMIRDIKFQCKLSNATFEKLINYYMIALCHRKCTEHLFAAIKLFPNHRKISYVLNLCKRDEFESDFRKAYSLQIAEKFIENLLQWEFKKVKSQQNIKNFNLYLQQLIDIAIHEQIKDENIEKVVLSATDMNVIPDYYYLAAQQFRLQMPKKSSLAVKLISIGISHDLTSLQEIKYSVKASQESLEVEYRLSYRRLYLALVTLGCIIKDYALRRLCFQAASVCESGTKFCQEILKYLPVMETVDQGDNLDETQLDLRYLLETFQYEIKDHTKLPETFAINSTASFDLLDYYNNTADFDEDLKPLEYPGVEKYMKKQAIEEKEHVSQTSDLDKCLKDIAEFNIDLSMRLKKMRNGFQPLRKQNLPSEEQIDLKVKEILSKCPDFRMSANGDIFYDLTTINFEDILSPSTHWDNLKADCNESNQDNLLFNFELSEKSPIDINDIYKSGTVDVCNLYYNGYTTYDIENITLYTVMEKKMKFISEEFAYLNKNRNVECEEEQNQVHACFLYLANKPHPENARLMRLSSTLRRFDNPLEYNLKYYVFDVTPGKYKYRHKNKTYKVREFGNTSENIDTSEIDNTGNGLMEVDNANLPATDIKMANVNINNIKDLTKATSYISIPQTIVRQKKEKIPPAISLAGVTSFNSSADIQNIFKILQIEISALLQKDVFIDVSKISDISSPHLVHCTSEMKSTLPIKIQKIRNGNLSPREIEREIKMPINVSGKLAIILEFRDEVKYDEFFENPYIASTLNHRVMSNLVIDHLTHSAKCEIDCIIEGLVSKIRCSFQGQKNYRPRKKVQKPTEINTEQQQHAVTPKIEILPPLPISNNNSSSSNSNNMINEISNIVMSVNTNNIITNPPQTQPPSAATSIVQDQIHNGMNYQNIQQTQTQNYNNFPVTNPMETEYSHSNVPVCQQYSVSMPQQPQYPPVCYAQSTDPNISTISMHTSVIQQQQPFMNGGGMQSVQQFQSNSQQQFPQIKQESDQQFQQKLQQQFSQIKQEPDQQFQQKLQQQFSQIKQEPDQQFQQNLQQQFQQSPQQQFQPQQQSSSVLQGQEPFICNPMASPNRVKPKVEILAIEDVSPVKIDLNNMTGMKKLSFSNPLVVPIKEEPTNGVVEEPPSSISVMTIEKPVKQEKDMDDELVDFEDEIQTTMVKSSTLPKKPIHVVETPRNLPQKSPPPLHYPVKNENNAMSAQMGKMDVHKDVPSPITSPVQLQEAQMQAIRPNVIKSPGIGQQPQQMMPQFSPGSSLMSQGLQGMLQTPQMSPNMLQSASAMPMMSQVSQSSQIMSQSHLPAQQVPLGKSQPLPLLPQTSAVKPVNPQILPAPTQISTIKSPPQQHSVHKQSPPQAKLSTSPLHTFEKLDEKNKPTKLEIPQIIKLPPETDEMIKKRKIDLTKNIAEILGSVKKKIGDVSKKNVTAVIDLTDDINEPSIDLTDNKYESERHKKKSRVPDITFVECDTGLSLSKSEKFLSSSEDSDFLRDSQERAKKNYLKRRLSSISLNDLRKCKVHLVDVMKDIDLNYLRENTAIRLQNTPNTTSYEQRVFKSHFKHKVAVEMQTEEIPVDPFVDCAYDATFTIVCHNSVSYVYNDPYDGGDGIANVIDRYRKCNNNINNNDNLTNAANYSYDTKLTNYETVKNKLKNSNVYNNNNNNNNNNGNYMNNNRFNLDSLNNYANNNNNINILKMIEINYLMKPSYSDKNHTNFTKNLKNRKKFITWTPKECNLNLSTDKKKEKSIFDDEKNHKSLLYQISHEVMNSIPGMNSLEFFKIPSSPLRKLQVEVVHLKEIKSSASNETNDVNDGTNNEPSNVLHARTDGNNIETISNATTIHIQKIGQTSISHETETRTLQTSFGSIIKNTYPPATSRVVVSNSDIMKTEKLIKLKQNESTAKKISMAAESSIKNASNVKIIACSSQQSMSNDASKAVNKNQTLINMLTQQVMVPTNSNRHYIITSATKSTDVKVENAIGTSCTLTTNNAVNNAIRKTVTNATGQSQLVQILNSPPSNFTMKSLNVISSTNQTTAKPGQIMTVTSPGDGMKAELPDSIKQQGVVQFICKTDGKIIHLTPICNNNAGTGLTKKITYKVDTSGAKGPTILHHANQQIILNNQLRKEENPNILTIIQKQSNESDKKPKNTIVGITQSSNAATSPMGTRSVYEETYAKFIQTPVGITTSSASDMGLLTISSTPVNSVVSAASTSNTFIQKIGKTVIQSSNQILPKFNQAFGKSIFSTTSLSEQVKATTARETITRSVMNTISPVKVTKNEKNEISFIESDSIEKPLPTLQSALQGNNLLYARPIGNGKLIASNNNNVLLTALRSNSNQTNNVRIITTIADSMSNTNRTIMTPVRISVPIQIPQLINSVRPQSPGNFRPQIVIAPAATTTIVRPQQQNVQNLNQSGSKLQSLLMGSQQITTNTTINHQQDQTTDIENNKVKVEQKQKKTVDNSTLEQLREFDMVLEQVLERSSVTPNSVASPPPDNSNHSSPRKQLPDAKTTKFEIKSSSVSITSNSPSDSPTSSKSLSSAKTTPKLQEDEHTAQRILDILANYKEQVRNSPDLNNKPAPRRRANPPTNPPAKRKKMTASTSSGSMKNSKQFGSSSDVMTDTMGSEEDSSCGVGSGVASTGSINNSPRGDIDDHTDVSMDNNFYMEDTKREIALSPQSSNSSVTTSPAHNKFSVSRRSLVIESKTNSGSDSVSSKSFILNNSQSSVSSASSITRTSIGESVERLSAQSSTTAVLMPGNYILPMNVLKGGQHLAILSSNNGQKIIAVPASQLTSPVSINNSSGTSIILQRYVNQMNEASGLGDKAILTHSKEAGDGGTKTLHFQQQQNSLLIPNNSSNKNHASAIYVKSINDDVKSIKQENDQHSSYDSGSSSNFVSDKTLITEIIQQQQQLSHNHPQHNFMIKLNEPSDPKSSSSIMFMGDTSTTQTVVKNKEANNVIKIKTEKLDYDGCIIKEEMMDLNNENEILNSPMLNTKMEVDENTSSNHDTNDADNSQSQKLPQFPSILSSCLTKQPNNANSVKNNTKGFLIDPSSKILMYNDRKQSSATTSSGIDKEIFNQKSFSEECADLGVDEPIASDLFPEADLLFDSGSPKFDQINPNDGNIQIKRELENGEVLLQMNYNNNMSEPWLNFDTEDELVDDSHGESSDDVREPGHLKNHF